MKKIYSTICMGIIALALLFPVTARSQDLTDAERLERCQNNKNRIAELEAQLSVINADLSASMTIDEMDDARIKLVFLRSERKVKKVGDYFKFARIAAQYNFESRKCLNSDADYIACTIELEKIIGRKIDKAMSLNRPELLAKKNEIDKQLANHRNNLLKWGCDQPTDISGNWASNIDVSYSISQTQSAFTWEAPKLHSKGQGTVTGKSVSVEWTGDWGPGSTTGQITKTDASGKATRIEWLNGVVFTRN